MLLGTTAVPTLKQSSSCGSKQGVAHVHHQESYNNCQPSHDLRAPLPPDGLHIVAAPLVVSGPHLHHTLTAVDHMLHLKWTLVKPFPAETWYNAVAAYRLCPSAGKWYLGPSQAHARCRAGALQNT